MAAEFKNICILEKWLGWFRRNDSRFDYAAVVCELTMAYAD
jgi:hypothetical protein